MYDKKGDKVWGLKRFVPLIHVFFLGINMFNSFFTLMPHATKK